MFVYMLSIYSIVYTYNMHTELMNYILIFYYSLKDICFTCKGGKSILLIIFIYCNEILNLKTKKFTELSFTR